MPQPARRKPGRPPAAKADETRQRIVNAAREVFSDRGYDGATFQQIAEVADLTRPAINHYFDSKRALYCAVVEASNELFVTTSSIEQARREKTLMGRLTAFITFAMRSNLANPSSSAFLITMLLESRGHPELTAAADEAVRLRRDFLTWAVAEAIASGELPDTDVGPVVEALLTVLCGVAFYAGYLRTPDEMESIIEELGRLLSGDTLAAKS